MPLVYKADKPRVQIQTVETAAGVDSPESLSTLAGHNYRGAAFNNTGSATRSLTHQRQTVIYTYLYTQLHSLYKFITHLKQKKKNFYYNTTTFTATPILQHYNLFYS